jgi:hypothetical protein
LADIHGTVCIVGWQQHISKKYYVSSYLRQVDFTKGKVEYMRSYSRLVAIFGLLIATCGASAVRAQEEQRCFDETSFCIAGRFREFWETNGGLKTFGFPLTEQREETVEGQRYQAQWFERARFELHPENEPPYDVLLGRIGADVLERQGRNWFLFPRSDPRAGCRFFAQTGHSVCGEIWQAWRAGGLEFDGSPGTSEDESLALFGLPLSDETRETIEGKEYTVQWFERARFELHPENEPPYNVLLGRLGFEYLSDQSPRLPQAHLDRILEAAREAYLIDEPLAPEHVLIYSLPAGGVPQKGVAMLLTPRADFLKDLQSSQPLSTTDVAQCDPRLASRILGGLSVVQKVNAVPVDDYALTLDPGCQSLKLIGANATITLPAIVQRIDLKDNPPLAQNVRLSGRFTMAMQAQPPVLSPPKQFSQPSGLISAQKICQFVAADADALASVCIILDTPAQAPIRNPIVNAVAQFGAVANSNRAVPDVVGRVALARCAAALMNEPAPYTSCTPSLILAALDHASPFVPASGGQIRDVALIVALEPLIDGAFDNRALNQPGVQLPPGPYLAHEVRLPSDPVVAPQVSVARLQLDRATGQPPFFIPIFSNLPLLAVAEQPSQAAIVGGWFFGCCFVFEC